jgi:hypothetical protein
MLISSSNEPNQKIKVETSTQKLHFEGLLKTATIRIDYEGKGIRSRNILPDMSVTEFLNIALALFPQQPAVETSKTRLVFDMPISLNAPLHLDDDAYLLITLSGNGTEVLNVHSDDNYTTKNGVNLQPSAIVVSKHTIDFDKKELEINTRSKNVFLFPVANQFTKIVHFSKPIVKGQMFKRTEFTTQDLSRYQQQLKHTMTDSGDVINGLYENARMFNVSGLDAITLHTDNDSTDYFYSIDKQA